MKVGVPTETADGERRVALVPEVVRKLVSDGHEVVVQSGAGAEALIPDELFTEAGASIAADAGEVWGADVVVKVAPPSAEEIEQLGDSSILIGFLAPLTAADTTRALASSGATAFAMEAIPRISRAQSMDALSSQSNVAGYRAALLGAQLMGRFYPMLMTAAGTIRPAKVLVLGAGVAGLQAIATARRLGAQVQGFDVRTAVKEQVESLGAKFLELEMDERRGRGRLRARAHRRGAGSASASCWPTRWPTWTWSSPPRWCPAARRRCWSPRTRCERMKPGAVIVDLAGEAGGNCELSEPGETVVRHDVTIAAPLNVPSDDGRARLPALRPQRPVAARADGRRGRRAGARLRRRDHRRRLHHAATGRSSTRRARGGRVPPALRPAGLTRHQEDRSDVHGNECDLITNLAILVLAGFVGYAVISKVPNTLHTPLMSGTNAIHGIVMLGGLLIIGTAGDGFVNKILLVIAIAFGTINVVGGFLVTDRMLGMFKSKPEPKPELEEENARERGASGRRWPSSGRTRTSSTPATSSPSACSSTACRG